MEIQLLRIQTDPMSSVRDIMAIQTYDGYFINVLRALSDGRTLSMKEIRHSVAEQTGVTEEELAIRTSSGSNMFGGRVNWAKTYLIKAGLVSKEGFNRCRITDRGMAALKSEESIDLQYLSRYPEFLEFLGRKVSAQEQSTPAGVSDSSTPEDMLSAALAEMNRNLEESILDRITLMTDSEFEVLVVDILKHIYGGDFDKSSEVVGGSGDEGIDGIVRQDRLGFNNIYIQAKKWNGKVGRPDVQKFAGALQGQNATYGAFITSSDFTKEARQYAEKVNQTSHIALVSGRDLVRLMMEYDVGVITRKTIEIKGVDADYFDSD